MNILLTILLKEEQYYGYGEINRPHAGNILHSYTFVYNRLCSVQNKTRIHSLGDASAHYGKNDQRKEMLATWRGNHYTSA